MCCCDDNPPEFYGCVHRKARKPHRCSECRRTITKGERYQEHSGLWDGNFDTFRWCAHCEAAHEIADRVMDELNRIHRLKYGPPGYNDVEPLCFCFTGLWESIEEAFGGPYNMQIARLIVAARRIWTIKRGPRKGELMAVPTFSRETTGVR